MNFKKCIKCQELKPLSEFSEDKRHKDGKYPYCKECATKYRYENKNRRIDLWKKYYPKNKEKIAERMKKYRQTNQERYLKYSKQYRENNKEKLAIHSKKYHAENKELEKLYQQEHKKEIKIYQETYYQENKEHLSKQNKKYYIEHKKEHNEYTKRYNQERRKTDLRFNLNCRIRTAINLSLKGNKAGRHWETLVGYTVRDLINRLQKTMPKNYCWNDFSEGRLHIDHKIPISAFNFTKSKHIDFRRCWNLGNLQLLPAKENLIKHNKLTRPFQPSLAL